MNTRRTEANQDGTVHYFDIEKTCALFIHSEAATDFLQGIIEQDSPDAFHWQDVLTALEYATGMSS